MPYILAIDQGTSSSRALIFDSDGRIVSIGRRKFEQSYLSDGWVEQDPEIIWQTTIAAARDAIKTARVAARDIVAMGITNQRETTLLWDAVSGEAVYPAIAWQDRRTRARCATMVEDGVEPELSEKTGLLVDPYFSSTKLEWLLKQHGIRRRANSGALRFGTVDSFLIWRFTNGSSHCTDATNASRTQLYDISNHSWSDVLLDYFGIPDAVLPEVKDSVAEFGICDARHFGAEIPILGVAGDQQAALIGQGCFSAGMTKSTYGTGCFVIANTGTERVSSQARLLTTVAYRVDGETTFALEGSIFVAGVAVKWLRDQVGLINESSETEACARRIGGNTREVFVVPAFTGLGAPHWRPDARGLITGLTLDDGKDEIVTATLKSIGFQTADLIGAFNGDGVTVSELRVDGGMVDNDWFCQFLSDVCNLCVERPEVTESSALGAATLASVGAGMWSGLHDVEQRWAMERRFRPSVTLDERERWVVGWRAAVKRTLGQGLP